MSPDLSVLAVVGFGGPLLGAYVSGLATLRAAREQTRRERRVELYTDLLPAVLPTLESGRGPAEEVRRLVEGIVREAAATSSEDRTRAQTALEHVEGAEQAERDYAKAQQEVDNAGGDAPRQQMSAADSRRSEEIKQAGARLREYLGWLDQGLS
jgi:hypothetical protein